MGMGGCAEGGRAATQPGVQIRGMRPPPPRVIFNSPPPLTFRTAPTAGALWTPGRQLMVAVGAHDGPELLGIQHCLARPALRTARRRAHPTAGGGINP